MDTNAHMAYALSPNRRVLTVKHRTPAGVRTATLHREASAGPFTDAEVDAALASLAARTSMLPGQRNITRRAVTDSARCGRTSCSDRPPGGGPACGTSRTARSWPDG
jgi:predicted amidohydrolase YtcJ